MKFKRTSVVVFLISVFAFAGMATSVVAKDNDNDITLHELQVFDNFLDAHPAIDKDLRKSPVLVTDKAYLTAHPDLKSFLESHPGVRNEVKDRPRFFVRREEHFDRGHRDITLAEVRNFDHFLDGHPGIDRDLAKEPKLINDKDYLAKHPDLREYLGGHPAVRADLHENPRWFMTREKRFDKQDRKIAGVRQEPKPSAPAVRK